MAEFKIEISGYSPKPCARPRIGKNGAVFSPTSRHEKQIATVFRAVANSRGLTLPLVGQLGLCLEIVAIRDVGDIDNRLKTVMDALQKSGIIGNDKQVKLVLSGIQRGNIDSMSLSVCELSEFEGDGRQIMHSWLISRVFENGGIQ